jgi:hypothetical protein
MYSNIFEMLRSPIDKEDWRDAYSLAEGEYARGILDSAEDLDDAERQKAIDELVSAFAPHIERDGDKLIIKESIRDSVFEKPYQDFCNDLQEILDMSSFERFSGSDSVGKTALSQKVKSLHKRFEEGLLNDIRIIDSEASPAGSEESMSFPEWIREISTSGRDETERYEGGAVYYVGGVISYHW